MVEEISKDQALKTLVKGSGITLFGLVVSQIIVYVLRLLLARMLTPDEYGILFLGLSLINIEMMIVLFGVTGGIERYVPYYNAKKNLKKTKGVIISSLKISLPISIFVFVTTFIFSEQIAIIFFHEVALSPVLRIFSFAIPLYAIYRIFSASLTALKRVKYDIFSWHIGRSLATLIAVLLFWFIGLGLIGATIGYIIGFAVAALFSFIFIERVFPLFKRSVKSVSMKREMLTFSLPLVFYTIMLDMMSRIDTIMLGALKTFFDVGIYQTAIPTSQILFIIPGAFSVLFVPVTSELLSKKKYSDIKTVYKTVSKWCFYINFPIFLVFILYPNAVINTLFGSEYLLAGSTLRILSIGYFIYFLGVLSVMILNLFEKTKYHTINTGVSLLLGIFLNYALIPVYGIEGAAMATTLTFTFYTIILMTEAYFVSGYFPFSKGMIKSFLSGVISILFVFLMTKILFIDLNIWILASMFTVFLVLYSLILLLLRGLKNEDIMMLRIIESKTGMKIKFLRNFIKKFI